MCAKSLQSCPTLATPWTLARQAARSMGFSKQEDWSGLPCPPPGGLPNRGYSVFSWQMAWPGGSRPQPIGQQMRRPGPPSTELSTCGLSSMEVSGLPECSKDGTGNNRGPRNQQIRPSVFHGSKWSVSEGLCRCSGG